MNDVRNAIADMVLERLDLRLDFLPRDPRDAALEVQYMLDENRLLRTITRTIDENDCTIDECVYDE